MTKKIGFIAFLVLVIFLASGSVAAKRSKAATKEDIPAKIPASEETSGDVSEEDLETITYDIRETDPVTEEMLIGYKDEDYYKKVMEGSSLEPSETMTIAIEDLEAYGDIDIIGYKDPDYYNRRPEYSHNSVLVSVDEAILDRAGMEALCEKYGLTIMYDYENFSMYALTREEAFSDEALEALIADLSSEAGILSVEKDSICYINDGANFDLGLSIH